MFESVESNNRVPAAKRLLALLISIALHALFILLIVVLPLVFFQWMPEVEFLTLLIAAPAPPPPPPPPLPTQRHQAAASKENIEIRFGPLDGIPEQLPSGIPATLDEPLPVISPVSIDGLGLGMMGSSSLADAIGIESLLHATAPTASLPPPPPPDRKPMLVGGQVQEAKLIRKVLPVYPEISWRARISGLVVLEVTIDEEGNVTSCKVLQGHPLLVEAAVQAVKLWKYSPTLLNGEPVPVVSTVNVNFVLNK
jgi:protein TonB